MHIAGKNDREVGEVREQLFAHNFCRVVAGLKPRIAIPFAADFALLSPEQRWINEVRFARSRMNSYYEKHFGEHDQRSRVHDMYPGDSLSGLQLNPVSSYREHLRNGRLDHLISEQYEKEIQQLGKPKYIAEADACLLSEAIKRNIEQRLSASSGAVASSKFCLKVTDVSDNNCYNIHFAAGHVEIERSGKPDASSMLLLETSSVVLRHSFGGEWGGDALSIGYGCEIDFLVPHPAKLGLDKVCLDLLSQYPTGRTYLWRNPIRFLRYVQLQSLRRWWARRRLKASEAMTYDSSVWLLKSKAELLELYDLPETTLSGN